LGCGRGAFNRFPFHWRTTADKCNPFSAYPESTKSTLTVKSHLRSILILSFNLQRCFHTISYFHTNSFLCTPSTMSWTYCRPAVNSSEPRRNKIKANNFVIRTNAVLTSNSSLKLKCIPFLLSNVDILLDIWMQNKTAGTASVV
jgi:hypothetical protein